MRILFPLLAVFLAASAAADLPAQSPASAGAAGRPRPNVVLVLIDDMGWGDFSCFGNTAARTPNIDRLAAEGLRFSQFYVASPICSPSRAGISTGQYPHRWRITSFLNNRAENEARGMGQWLDPRAPMPARLAPPAPRPTRRIEVQLASDATFSYRWTSLPMRQVCAHVRAVELLTSRS